MKVIKYEILVHLYLLLIQLISPSNLSFPILPPHIFQLNPK